MLVLKPGTHLTWAVATGHTSSLGTPVHIHTPTTTGGVPQCDNNACGGPVAAPAHTRVLPALRTGVGQPADRQGDK